jgi:hypothetical protein
MLLLTTLVRLQCCYSLTTRRVCGNKLRMQDGSAIPVTDENRHEYVDLIVNQRLLGARIPGLSELRTGFLTRTTQFFPFPLCSSLLPLLHLSGGLIGCVLLCLSGDVLMRPMCLFSPSLRFSGCCCVCVLPRLAYS